MKGWKQAYVSWREDGNFPYRASQLMLEGLLDSDHATTEAEEADYFFVPTWEWVGAWGSKEIFYRAHRYIYTTFPFWNRSAGADHVWLVSRDAGTCSDQYGSLLEVMGASLVLTHWGGVTGLDGELGERCFLSGQDIVIPGAVRPYKILQSPFLQMSLSASAAHTLSWGRRTQLFFMGALCWRTTQKVNTMEKLQQKCSRSWDGGGAQRPVAKYAFGLRFTIWKLHRHEVGFRLLATDFPPSLPKPARSIDVNAEIRNAKYCLCPSGTGWGMRAVHAILLGCVPVVVQHDGINSRVAQAVE